MLNLEEIEEGLKQKQSTDGKKIIIDGTLKYFNILKQQRYHFILSIVQSLSSRQSEIPSSKLVKYLKNILQSADVAILKKQYESLEEQIMQFLKEAINQFIFRKRQGTEDRYDKISKRNQRYIDLSSQKTIKAMTYAISINNLISIDILSIFLKQNQSFRQSCLINANYWSPKMLKSIIPLSLELLERLSNFYPNVEKYLNFDIDKRIKGIVEIFALIKLSFRLSNIKKMSKQDVADYFRTKHQKISKKQTFSIKQLKIPVMFNFCEFIIFSQQREKDFFLLKDQVEVLQRLKEIKSQLCQQSEKILDLKFTYKVSLTIIIEFLSKISKDKEFYQQFFEKEQNIPTSGLQIILEYDFPTYKSFDEGAKACDLQRYNTFYIPIQAILKCPRKVKSHFLNTVLQQFATIQKIKYSIATQYQKCHRPILYITKIQISYHKLKNQSLQHEDDLILTFLIGMTKENIKFTNSYQGKINQSLYFQQIKEKLKKTIGIHPFHVVISSSAFKREFSNSGFRKIRNYIMEKHKSSFNIDEQSFFSLDILKKKLKLFQHLALIAPKLTRANFYEKVNLIGLRIIYR